MSEETIEKHRKRRSTSSVIRTNVNKYLHFIHIKLTKVKKKKPDGTNSWQGNGVRDTLMLLVGMSTGITTF